MITSELSPFPPALPSRKLTPGAHSNPIGRCPPRQRLPPSLLIENASDPVFRPCHLSCPRRFRSRLATIRPEAFIPHNPRSYGMNPAINLGNPRKADRTFASVCAVARLATRAAPDSPLQVLGVEEIVCGIPRRDI